MAKIIKFKSKEKFEILKRKNPKIIPFYTKEELQVIEKKKKERELLRWIIDNEKEF